MNKEIIEKRLKIDRTAAATLITLTAGAVLFKHPDIALLSVLPSICFIGTSIYGERKLRRIPDDEEWQNKNVKVIK